jgi:hypothetical protein
LVRGNVRGLVRVKIGGIVGGLLLAPWCAALDYQQSVDLTSAASLLSNPPLSGLPDSAQAAETSANGQLSGYWNLLAFPSAATQVNLRYGWSAQGTASWPEQQQASSAATTADYRLADYRLEDLDAELWASSTENLGLYQQLDALSVTWYSPFGEWVLGRQPISFGLAKFYSPIDVMQPIELIATDRSYRPGVDALRATWFLGPVSSLEAGYVMGVDRAVFGRLKAFVLDADWQLTAIQINDQYRLAAVGVQSGIGAVGLWQETAWLRASGSSDLRVTLGVDMTLFEDWYLVSELHYNGLGAGSDYLQNAAGQGFYQIGAVLPLAQWYASVQVSYPINVLTQWSTGATLNVNDNSALFNSALAYSVSNDMALNLSAVLPLATARSLAYEYGVYPSVFTAQLQWVF